jgi:hypothetical protein
VRKKRGKREENERKKRGRPTEKKPTVGKKSPGNIELRT